MFFVKWFDKRIALSSKGQMYALAFAFAALIIAGAAVGHYVLDAKSGDNAKFGRTATWGIMQCVDGGFVDATISSNTRVEDGEITRKAPLHVIFLSLGFWVFGAVLMSVFTGAVASFLDSRRERIMNGTVDYSFKDDYVLIVGFDFQVKNLVEKLLKEHAGSDFLVMTECDVRPIQEDMLPELTPADAGRVFFVKKEISYGGSYDGITVSKAREIYLIGDDGDVGRDGKILQALEKIVEKAGREDSSSARASIRLYLHINDSVLYSQVRAMKLPGDGEGLFDLEVYNYYESWAWRCWSARTLGGVASGEADYLPLHHVKDAERTELFIIGAGRMGRTMVNYAMTLMNYGEDGKKSRITVFDADPLKKGFLPDRETVASLPEVEVVYSAIDGMSDEADEIMMGAARRGDTSVTIVIALSDPGAASRAYTELSNGLRRTGVSVLVWQSLRSRDCTGMKYLRIGGDGSTAEKAHLRYFGMTDHLPWRNSARFDSPCAVNYYYWKFYDETSEPHPEAASMDVADPRFPEAARAAWDQEVAQRLWSETLRWKKWSSASSGDSFAERATVLAGGAYPAVAGKAIKAEHNRWWSERLLTGWRFSGEIAGQDKANMLHPDMIPFEDLSDAVRDKDKIVIAGMSACGFLPADVV